MKHVKHKKYVADPRPYTGDTCRRPCSVGTHVDEDVVGDEVGRAALAEQLAEYVERQVQLVGLDAHCARGYFIRGRRALDIIGSFHVISLLSKWQYMSNDSTSRAVFQTICKEAGKLTCKQLACLSGHFETARKAAPPVEQVICRAEPRSVKATVKCSM